MAQTLSPRGAKMSPAAPSSSPPPGVPSPGLRALISYLIFLHFFFLLVGIRSRGIPSGFDLDLAEKVPGLRAYLQTLVMDLSYMVQYTYYDPNDPNEYSESGTFQPEDTDFVIEADIPQPDGSVRTITWPTEPLSPRIRGFRIENLAMRAAINSEMDDSDANAAASLLAQGVARRIMAEQGCAELTRKQPMVVRFRRRLLQNLMLPEDQMLESADVVSEPGSDPPYRIRDPKDPSYLQTAYEVRAFLTPDNEVNVAQTKAAFNTAAPQAAPTSTRPRATPPGRRVGTGTSP